MICSLIKNPLDVLGHGLGSWSQAVSVSESCRMQEMDVERDREGRSKRSDPFKLGRQERDWLVRLARVRCITHLYSVSLGEQSSFDPINGGHCTQTFCSSSLVARHLSYT